jgi:hypothetical protein
MYEQAIKTRTMRMQNSLIMMDKIQDEHQYISAKEDLKTIYKEILRLVIKKEEYEEKIEEYLNTQT